MRGLDPDLASRQEVTARRFNRGDAVAASDRRLALVQVVDGSETALWQADTPYQPTLSIKDVELRWADASRASLSWPTAELQAHYSAAQQC